MRLGDAAAAHGSRKRLGDLRALVVSFRTVKCEQLFKGAKSLLYEHAVTKGSACDRLAVPVATVKTKIETTGNARKF